ncbi:MAG: membrane-bound PQQ-dependent dehydrogenase, glucose/quinate/shikimate family [Xanthomonadaceae bacterium]|nr:membrane-bound PQQ-dependent dehydrogenase, glucose/quinate/shikimate family [Xanthomonadaceae bacterium]
MRTCRKILAIVFAIMALYLIVLGAKLGLLGGSFYYVLIGLAYLLVAVLTWRSDARAVYLAGAAFVVTLIWAFFEAGVDYWALFPRLLAPLAIACVVLSLFSTRKTKQGRWFLGSASVVLVAWIAFFARGFVMVPTVPYTGTKPFVIADSPNTPVDWTGYSRDTMGTRYSPFTQINRNNVKDLQPAWTYRTGRNTKNDNLVDQNTPLQLGNTIYSCTPENSIHAIDGTTGKRKWLFEAKATAEAWGRCRGLGSYQEPTPVAGAVCNTRIILNTIDGRLFALDSETGAKCPGFGTGVDGSVNLLDKMGPEGPGYLYQNSAPLVAGDKIVVSGWIADNQSLGEPAGALRAFDVHSGELLWAWDPGNPAVTKEPVGSDHYTLGTPNMWTHAAYDPKLGLIYAPMGNGGTDAYNPERPKESIKFNDAIVALDVNTGRPKWWFQTTHHDMWDLDIASQPSLLDMKNDKGVMVPAILVFTKRGHIFTFDRRDGTPITKIVENPVPTEGGIPENIVSPTQPDSVGMPVLAVPPLTEARTWGMTMFDQLLCRISYKQLRNAGNFTPLGLDWSIVTPSAMGGQNWGSASYDPVNRRLFVNDIRLPNITRLMTRADYAVYSKTHVATPDGHTLAPMWKTPYATHNKQYMSPLTVPCPQPPFGTISAIDLDTRKIVWQVPGGTAKQLGPMGLKLGMPLTPGMPTYAGSSTTAGGLVFYAATQDYYLRAYDAETGKELWKYPLPVGASATPMSYISPVDHRQYVVISVGGAAHSKDVGDYVMAFALPANTK